MKKIQQYKFVLISLICVVFIFYSYDFEYLETIGELLSIVAGEPINASFPITFYQSAYVDYRFDPPRLWNSKFEYSNTRKPCTEVQTPCSAFSNDLSVHYPIKNLRLEYLKRSFPHSPTDSLVAGEPINASFPITFYQSAYVDHRFNPPRLRIFAVNKCVKNNQFLVADLHFNGNNSAPVRKNIYGIPMEGDCPSAYIPAQSCVFNPYIFSIGLRTNEDLRKVTIHLGSRKVELDVQKVHKKSTEGITVCLQQPVYYYSQWQNIVLYIEAWRAQGATRFIVYFHSATKETWKTLEYYRDLGMIEIKFWPSFPSLPAGIADNYPKIDNSVFIIAAYLAMNICILDIKTTVGTVADFDEVMVPSNGRLLDYATKEMAGTKVGALSFENHYISFTPRIYTSNFSGVASPKFKLRSGPTKVTIHLGSRKVELDVQKIHKKTTEGLTVCVLPVHYFSQWQNIVLYIEAWRAQGATHFIIYFHSATNETWKTLEYYKDLGIVDIKSWPSFPGLPADIADKYPRIDDSAYIFSYFLAINICILDIKTTIGTVADFDEVMVPTNGRLLDYATKEMTGTKVGALSFENHYVSLTPRIYTSNFSGVASPKFWVFRRPPKYVFNASVLAIAQVHVPDTFIDSSMRNKYSQTIFNGVVPKFSSEYYDTLQKCINKVRPVHDKVCLSTGGVCKAEMDKVNDWVYDKSEPIFLVAT
ncbi:Protein CBG11355 [Caenorhabditis briggsae]|uniref:Protein CBG11355 n=1 Tax=Caenorhabditis briggsae TaxID=6238 RepID=A8XD75_CAEBR|nr:Protein CBG11355 [Caenorhabditis briggsae]CAP30594.2 Protein CBG11355 [Caenorhabditis briggsae]